VKYTTWDPIDPARADVPADPARRRWLTEAPAGLVAAATFGASSLAYGASPAPGPTAPVVPPVSTPPVAASPIDSTFLQFADERERFKAHFRFERDLRDQGEAVSWYHFALYALAPDARPVPVVRFEGMEYSYFRRLGDLTWRIHAHNLSFPRDLATGAFVSQVLNPLSGERVTVPPMVLLDDPGVLHSPRGYLPLDSRAANWLSSYLMFRTEGELVKVDHIRPTPDGWPKMFIESSTSAVPRSEFDDPRVTSLKFQTSGFYAFPFPKWMGMGERPGHMIGAWSGRKLGGANELPVEFRARARAEHPTLLQARWGEFDRPLPAALGRVT
jgi:hypothetical protein